MTARASFVSWELKFRCLMATHLAFATIAFAAFFVWHPTNNFCWSNLWWLQNMSSWAENFPTPTFHKSKSFVPKLEAEKIKKLNVQGILPVKTIVSQNIVTAAHYNLRSYLSPERSEAQLSQMKHKVTSSPKVINFLSICLGCKSSNKTESKGKSFKSDMIKQRQSQQFSRWQSRRKPLALCGPKELLIL